MDLITMTLLALTNFSNQFVGQLYRNLAIMGLINLHKPTSIMENAGIYTIPVQGLNLVANDRAAGALVTDQDPDAEGRSITYGESYVSFPVDAGWAAQPNGRSTVENNIKNAVNVLTKKVARKLLQELATRAGVAQVGTIGADLVLADFQETRRTLTDNEADDAGRVMLLSTMQMDNALNIDEYSRYDAGGIAGIFADGRARRIEGFNTVETPYVYSPAADQHIGVAMDPSGVHGVMPAQETFTDGSRMKVGAENDGVRLYIMHEPRERSNGGYRVIVSTVSGFRLIDTRKAVQLLGK